MPKKFGDNPKATAAREREQEKKTASREAKARADEDAAWRDDDEDARRKTERKAEKDRKTLEAAQKKAELRKLAEEEDAAMAKISSAAKKSAAATPVRKVTQADIAATQAAQTPEPSELKRGVSVDMTPLELNPNHAAVDGEEARSVDAAIAMLDVSPQPSGDLHPERRYMAAYLAYEEENLARIKKEYPSLRLMQWKHMLAKEFKKSPRNPYNQV